MGWNVIKKHYSVMFQSICNDMENNTREFLVSYNLSAVSVFLKCDVAYIHRKET